jgi:hypothetical protein
LAWTRPHTIDWCSAAAPPVQSSTVCTSSRRTRLVLCSMGSRGVFTHASVPQRSSQLWATQLPPRLTLVTTQVSHIARTHSHKTTPLTPPPTHTHTHKQTNRPTHPPTSATETPSLRPTTSFCPHQAAAHHIPCFSSVFLLRVFPLCFSSVFSPHMDPSSVHPSLCSPYSRPRGFISRHGP